MGKEIIRNENTQEMLKEMKPDKQVEAVKCAEGSEVISKLWFKCHEIGQKDRKYKKTKLMRQE